MTEENWVQVVGYAVLPLVGYVLGFVSCWIKMRKDW